jgi:hypothetical protein
LGGLTGARAVSLARFARPRFCLVGRGNGRGPAMRRVAAAVAAVAAIAPLATRAERYLSYSCYEDHGVQLGLQAGLYPVDMGCRCNVGYFGSSVTDDNDVYVSQTCTACPPAATTAWAGKAARSDCNCVAGYTGNIIDGGSDAANMCSECAVNSFSPGAIGGDDFACTACPANSGTGTRTGRSSRGDCLCDAQFTGDMGALDLQLPITGAPHPAHPGAVASIDAEAYGGANSVTLAAVDSSISRGQTLQLADTDAQNICAATPKGSDLVVAAVDGAVIYFATDLTKGDPDAATNCIITRAAPSCTNLVNQAAGWASADAMVADGWVMTTGMSVRTAANTPISDTECFTHTGGESFYGFLGDANVGELTWKFKEADGPGFAHLDFGNCWGDPGSVTATLTRVRDGRDISLGSADPEEHSVEADFSFEAGDILTLRDTGQNSVMTVNSFFACAHGDAAMHRDAACVACETGKYKDSRGTADCTPIVDCAGSWSEWTSGLDLCTDGTDGYGTSHSNLESRVYTITQPYFTPVHGADCAFSDGEVQTRDAAESPPRYGGDRWLTVDVTVEDRGDLPDTVGGIAAVRVVVVTIVPIAHGVETDSDGIADGKNVGIDPPTVTIDGVPVKLKESERISFKAERAVSTGDCVAPDGGVGCDGADGGTATACVALTDGAGEACVYVHQPLVSITGLRSCGANVLEKTHEFSGLGHFRVWLPADPATPAPAQY